MLACVYSRRLRYKVDGWEMLLELLLLLLLACVAHLYSKSAEMELDE